MKSPRGQLLERQTVQGLLVELPVKALQGARITESSLLDPTFNASLAAGVGGNGKKTFQQFQMRKLLLIDARQQFIQLTCRQRYLQRLEMLEDPLAGRLVVAVVVATVPAVGLTLVCLLLTLGHHYLPGRGGTDTGC